MIKTLINLSVCKYAEGIVNFKDGMVWVHGTNVAPISAPKEYAGLNGLYSSKYFLKNAVVGEPISHDLIEPYHIPECSDIIFDVPYDIIVSSYKELKVFISNDDKRLRFNGVYFDPEGCSVATNGQILKQIHTGFKPVVGFTIHKDMLNLMEKMNLPKNTVFKFTRQHIFTHTDGERVYSDHVGPVECIREKYPEWRKIIPTYGDCDQMYNIPKELLGTIKKIPQTFELVVFDNSKVYGMVDQKPRLMSQAFETSLSVAVPCCFSRKNLLAVLKGARTITIPCSTTTPSSTDNGCLIMPYLL